MFAFDEGQEYHCCYAMMIDKTAETVAAEMRAIVNGWFVKEWSIMEEHRDLVFTKAPLLVMQDTLLAL